ncbi:GIY-YIG nuclease family protein [Ensifer sp. ENS03]|uniref:GIY-YIG nuclease family protein n=1 Tax=Ensifer sp. ENS03 TaxID=2769283 RepID=UPI000B5B4F98|nr:GIY-YIG nuclease family protein [Ensifer sp. ENS03]MBD9560582.1 GIY-YIG nuclease family protein [Ensifer sp. ENS03]OWZ90523.1 hypothetical protein B9J07_27150 [Sinorhizobium sp. LM21]
MSVYFVTELDNSLAGKLYVKIGRSQKLTRRLANLQTGNRRTIALMGEIRTASVEEDKAIEQALHLHFEYKSDAREWYFLTIEDVIEGLKLYSSQAYIAVGQNAFEIVSYDKDAVPEFASPWLWGDVDCYQFCPHCGWACGWTYSENYGGDVCLECGASEHDYDARDAE